MLHFKICLFLHREKYKTAVGNYKLKIKAPTWNDEFPLHDGSNSVSNIQNHIVYIIKNIIHYPLPTNPPIHIYISGLDNRLVLKKRDGYKLELAYWAVQGNKKNGENAQRLEVIELVLVQCNM